MFPRATPFYVLGPYDLQIALRALIDTDWEHILGDQCRMLIAILLKSRRTETIIIEHCQPYRTKSNLAPHLVIPKVPSSFSNTLPSVSNFCPA